MNFDPNLEFRRSKGRLEAPTYLGGMAYKIECGNCGYSKYVSIEDWENLDKELNCINCTEPEWYTI